MTDARALPPELEAWVSSVAGGPPVRVRRHLAGASRQAWSLDVEGADGPAPLFLLRDTGRGGGSVRDAAVLRALAPTPVPVPEVRAVDPALRAVLLERVPGRSDFPAVDHDDEREPTAAHLMQVAAALHRLDPATLDVAHLGRPEEGTDHAAVQLASVEGVAAMAGEGLHPVFPAALSWLRANAPGPVGRTSLVHSDLGPGNFLALGGRVTALLDWEVAHWGDPMEDLAALAVRDMATPVGDLATRYAEYEAAGGPAVDLGAVAWYRILVLVRNSMLIGLGLGAGETTVDRVELTRYRTMLMRAAALALCDAAGSERPVEAPFEEAPATDLARLVAHAGSDQGRVVVPAVPEGAVDGRHRAEGVARVLAATERSLRSGPDLERRTLEDLTGVLGHRPASVAAGRAEVADLAAVAPLRPDLVRFVARDLVRDAMVLEPLLGELADRVPQRLEQR